jgi:hypothetical protein
MKSLRLRSGPVGGIEVDALCAFLPEAALFGLSDIQAVLDMDSGSARKAAHVLVRCLLLQQHQAVRGRGKAVYSLAEAVHGLLREPKTLLRPMTRPEAHSAVSGLIDRLESHNRGAKFSKVSLVGVSGYLLDAQAEQLPRASLQVTVKPALRVGVELKPLFRAVKRASALGMNVSLTLESWA